MGRHAQNLAGKIFGKLTVVAPATYQGKHAWRCACACGGESVVPTGSLTQGLTKSCGCSRHKWSSEHTRSSAYSRFKHMWSRCGNPTNPEWKNYGGRGIYPCHRWIEFKNFHADMGDCPLGLSLERKDNNGPYEKSNCVWATPREQALNRRVTKLVTLYGTTLCVKDWAKLFGVKYSLALEWHATDVIETRLDQLIFRNPDVRF